MNLKLLNYFRNKACPISQNIKHPNYQYEKNYLIIPSSNFYKIKAEAQKVCATQTVEGIYAIILN